MSGIENLDSGVGIYAPDAESYNLFAPLFNPVIEDYHGGFKVRLIVNYKVQQLELTLTK